MEGSGAGKAWNDQKFLYWIHPVSDAAARAKWLHSFIHKAFRYSGRLDIGV